MTTVIGSGGVSLAGVFDDDSIYQFNLASTITVADVGKAVTIDASGDTQVKLCGDTDIILGRLETVETRTVEGINVGAVATEGGLVLSYTGTAPTKGASVQGSATAGVVKALAAADGQNKVVVSVDTTNTKVTVLFL